MIREHTFFLKKKNKKLSNGYSRCSTHSEYVQVIKCDFKPGLVERSIDLGIPLPMKIEKIHSGVLLYHILTVLKTF
jgi:hypothetical protein